MGCPYEFYKPEEQYFPRLYCKISGNYCIYSKQCMKHEKYIAIEGDKWKGCYMYIESESKNIPSGSYLVQSSRPSRSGKLYLYVVIRNNVVKILSDFTTLNQNYVYLRRMNDAYEVSLTPFKRKIKKNDQEAKN